MAKEQPKESNDVAGVNLPANVVFTHNGSNTMYVGNHISKADNKEGPDRTVINGRIQRMVLQDNGHIMVYVGADQGQPGRLFLTATGMLVIMKNPPKEPKP